MFIHIVKEAGFIGEESVRALLTDRPAAEMKNFECEVISTIPISQEDCLYWRGASQNSGFCELIQRLALTAWRHGQHHERATHGTDHV